MNPLHADDLLPFDDALLGAVSRGLSESLFTSLPQLLQFARLAKSCETDGLSLVVNVPSPTGDADRQFAVWVDEFATPSIGFGPSHTHQNDQDGGITAIVALAKGILDDTLLVIEEVGGKYAGHGSWIDLREEGALEERLTSPYSSGSALLKSWSGKGDRKVSTENFMR